LSTEEKDALLKKEDSEKATALLKLHESFISTLKGKLSAEQVEKVKDGMTYRILPITYEAYLDMLPRLTEEQNTKIYSYLQEARELAMDAESSDKKHAVFGKYKGRINNYLSAAGFDMKKEGEEWQKRIKERETAKKDK
jgi:ABC-type Na+ transport system ATPase subunit NatA